MINYYSALNLPPTASEHQIKDALNRELRMWSNRTNAPQMQRRQEAERKVKQLEEAEAILLDSSRKAEYDKKLRTAPPEEASARAEVDLADVEPGKDLIQEGWELLITDRVADAIYVATKATEFEGKNPEAWALLAQAKFRWGEVDDAIYEYKRAIKLKPNEAEYYFDIGCVFESAERWQEAVDSYGRASKVNPQVTMYRAAIGSVYVRLEMHDEAIPILEQCVAEEGDNDTYQWFLAIAYRDMAVNKTTRVGDRFIFHTEQAATFGQQYFSKALALHFSDDDLRKEIRSNLEYANWSLNKHWARPVGDSIKVGVGLAVLFFILVAAADGVGFLIGAAVIALWVYTGVKPGWKINAMAPNIPT
jgi:tetratricopeptide (TPR) repeat protein